jgi:hypothetical protein
VKLPSYNHITETHRVQHINHNMGGFWSGQANLPATPLFAQCSADAHLTVQDFTSASRHRFPTLADTVVAH